ASAPAPRLDPVKSNASNMFMISSTDFTVSLLGRMRFSTANRTPGGASTAGRGEADGFVSGRSHDRQRAVLMSATGQLRGRLRAVSRVRCQSSRVGLSRGAPLSWCVVRDHQPQGSPACLGGATRVGIFSEQVWGL